jgi:hypothetical protein
MSHVDVDHKAKIAWVKNGSIPIASFAFEQWGGAKKAQMAAERFLECGEESPWELEAEITRLRAKLAKADALAGASEGAGNWMAVLHDLIENSDCNPDDLEYFDEVLRDALMFVNRLEEELAAYREADT